MPKAEAKTFVDTKVAGKRVVMFQKTWCPFCVRAKKLLNTLVQEGKISREDLDIIDLDNNPDMGDIQDYLLSITGGRSVPRVFIKQKSIGGCDELHQLHNQHQLEAMLK